ncbi:glycoside hydrolase family 2 TIM barrel-domain containing protein [Chitinophaga silvisoli]|uniref:Glycoside hydrolase family 2 protein n=1 Tax=Chitinophaga silvisoli TaxID=2291814 RepID=A0A3E1P462_9BACT|nr:glycoside hydrolase family 2 TIM barrel-domain containing protein [Chitinophaga silvisoli]RFM34962.1 glycoside hydrolase family 2 protein [Chitinophaga silvisoli]
MIVKTFLRQLFLSTCLLTALTSIAQKSPKPTHIPLNQREIRFDDNWLFQKDSLLTNARIVQLPHDWSIEDLPNQNDSTIIGPFYKYSPAKEQGAYTLGGTAWYKKSFTLPELQNHHLHIRFDGVYMNSDVWINGHHLGNHPYGYTPFTYDLTPYLLPAGKVNTITVKVKNEGITSRWYTGSGIYRHVFLVNLPELHLNVADIAITSKSDTISVNTPIPQNTSLHLRLLDSSNNIIAESNSNSLHIPNPIPWSPDHPYLYKTEISLIKDNITLDKVIIPTGIRDIKIGPKTGLFINGTRTLLKGANIHHDNGLLGAAAFDRAEERKIVLLKENGFNAIRTSHNPPSPRFLEVCDSLGLLVIDEAFDTWDDEKTPADYSHFFREHHISDLEAIVRRDRNHPSVIMWSIGNEIPERAEFRGMLITKELIATIRNLDTTRPITAAFNNFPPGTPTKWEDADPSLALLDVAGYNYMWDHYFLDKKRVKDRVMMGTETTAQDLQNAWNHVEGLNFVLGDFVWSGMDYLGEAGIGHSIHAENDSSRLTWPWFNAWCGDLDITGEKKPQSYYRDVVWRRSPIEIMVHAPDAANEKTSYWGWPDELPRWSYPDQLKRPMKVRVFTRAKYVKLEQNGEVLATQETATDLTATFEVKVKPGTIVANALDRNKKPIGVRYLVSTSEPAAIALRADTSMITADPESLSYINVDIMDAEGNVVPYADLPLQINISGPATLAGAGSGCPNRMASFQQLKLTTFRGKGLIILRNTGHAGKIKVEVSGENLKTGHISIKAK